MMEADRKREGERVEKVDNKNPFILSAPEMNKEVFASNLEYVHLSICCVCASEWKGNKWEYMSSSNFFPFLHC